ncbi:Endoplasmic reticulum mannosyl-oligosaccharide 1,2-alpha-mannosidase [Phlyctochytrium planicorne]|nr:Endoplasmic reticulum mannosyl-oligosaccharide 1,2-alpha-mannosidase [Phlyctochytrium planicorne]
MSASATDSTPTKPDIAPEGPDSKPSPAQVVGSGPSSPAKNKPVTPASWEDRRKAVASAFDSSWVAYRTHAMGQDELKPISKAGNSWLHLGISVFDALDTAWIMNRTDIFDECADWVVNKFEMKADIDANVFETTIRVLGGSLSAYHLSGREDFKGLAVKVAEKLMPAFQESSTLPLSSINLASGNPIGSPYDVSTAEATSIQLEFKYLSHITGDAKYWNAVEKVMRHMDTLEKFDGLVPIYMSAQMGNFKSSEIRLGSNGDSYYEYLGKQYILTNRTEKGHLRQYLESVKGIKMHLLRRSEPSKLLYVQEVNIGETTVSSTSPKMDHLVCYLPGTLAVMATNGTHVAATERSSRLTIAEQEDLHIAEELARTCYEMYHQSPIGLGPEIVFFKESKGDNVTLWLDAFQRNASYAMHRNTTFVPKSMALDVKDGVYESDFYIKPGDAHHLLRPEVIEGIFYLYRATGDVKYREWGWKMFEALEKHAKVETGGYTSLSSVKEAGSYPRDKMESFFLGETLKYYYLLFSEPDVIPLTKYVFNTEAHPLPIFDVREDMKDKLLIIDEEKKKTFDVETAAAP